MRPLFTVEANMIRPLSATDLDAAVELWYQASAQANDFIPAAFWHSRNGFKEGEQQLCEHSGHPELVMHWQRG
ncbi:hypothetical protein [Aeromonas veronii]|uniref:hypothetical protein n=1 Tax=Aeromonas veronii TaxID=654 RepID=UPI003B9EE6C3